MSFYFGYPNNKGKDDFIFLFEFVICKYLQQVNAFWTGRLSHSYKLKQIEKMSMRVLYKL